MSNKDEVQTQQPVAFLMQSTIADVLSQRIQEMSTSPKMLDIIDTRIEKFLKDIVDDSFSSWGDFSKGVKEAFKTALPGNIDSVIDLGRYNSMVQERLRATFASSGIVNDMMTKAETVFKEAMDETLLPSVIMLSMLLESYVDYYKEKAFEEGWEMPDFRLDESETYSTQFMQFYFDTHKPETTSYSHSSRSCYTFANSLAMMEVRGSTINNNKVYEIYSAKLNDKLIQHIVSTNGIRSNWEKMVFALYYGQSKICIDCDPDDYSYPGNN